MTRYRTKILASGNNTGIPVPEHVLAQLGGSRRPAVTVTIRGHSYRNSVAAMNGAPIISLSAENREKAGVKAGDEVEVDLRLDTAPREVSLPPDLAAALEADEQAKQTWAGLSYSNRRWHVESIEGAKTDTTRQRRIAKSVAALGAGRSR